jgi:hypothetical protein
MKVGFLLDEKGEPLPIFKADKEDRVWPNSLYTLVGLSNGVNNPTVSPLEWVFLWLFSFFLWKNKKEKKEK